MKPTRREVLLALAAASCGMPPEAGPASSDFPLGVACGDATETGGRLWTVFVGSGPVSVRVWPRADELRAKVFGVEVDEAQVAAFDVTALEPSTWYSYVFIGEAGATQSDVGSFRTRPAAEARPALRFAVTSCARQTESLAPLAVVAQQYPVDAYLSLGDSVYADGATTLADYRVKWRGALARRPNRLMRGATSLIATWDDHEVRNDVSADRVSPEQLDAARAAFFEHQPLRPAAPNRLWRSLRWGLTAEIFVLDCRGERNHATGEYLSTEQLEWLKAGVAASPATFKLIMNSVPISNYPGALYAAFADDRWQGWPAQRADVLSFIDQHRAGVLWLTGDFHIGVAGRVSLEGPGSSQVEIAAGPAGTNFPNPALSYPSPPQFDFASAVNNVVLLDLMPETNTARVQFVAGDGRVVFDHSYVV
jgi:alkaline phosphatase D